MRNIKDLIVALKGNKIIVKYKMKEFFLQKYYTNDTVFNIVNDYIKNMNLGKPDKIKSIKFVNE